MTTSDLPALPRVEAVVRDDGTAEVTIQGVAHPITAADVVSARAAATRLIALEAATPAGRAVRVTTTDPTGHWEMVVHPDGTVEPLQPEDLVGTVGPAVDPIWSVESGGPLDDEPRELLEETTVLDLASVEAPVIFHTAPDLLAVPAAPASPSVPAVPVASAVTEDDTTWQAPAATAQTPVDPAPAAPAQTRTGTRPATSSSIAAPTAPSAAPATAAPTLDDLIASRPEPPAGPAQRGWQASVRRLSGGLIRPAPGPDERAHRRAVESVQRSLDGPKTVVVVNPKGGGTKTTASFLVASTFGIHRGGYTLAWDNNETRGTLGWRAQHARHTNTAVDLLRDLERFADARDARVGDLDNYVRSQGSAQFDVLASDEDPDSAASIDAEAFHRLHSTLSRFYRVLVVDTGNNMRASNWQAAVEAADQLVIVSTVREDTAQSAAWLVDALRATGREDKVRQAVTVLTAPSRTVDVQLSRRLHEHFGRLTRVVLDVPNDPSLTAGGPISYDALSPVSREAWLRVTAAVADGL